MVEFQRSTRHLPEGPLVLFVEDDVVLRDHLAVLARRAGFQALVSGSVDEALAVVAQRRPDCIVSDIKMPGDSGMVLPARLLAHGHRIPIVMLTGEVLAGEMEQLQRLGIDCLIKPVGPSCLTEALNRLLGPDSREAEAAEAEAAEAAEAEASSGSAFGSMVVGSSPVMRRLCEQIDRASRTRATVLIEGPSGSGKELIARALHARQGRRAPFVALNCAAMPEGLVESTLFGHERGAFTGAVRSTRGAFERANGGSLLLDEISEMRLDLQAKLLRVLQERTFQRVGGDALIPVDVRIIATTNRDLVASVEREEFREDLYYRLNVMQIRVPSLEERREDIPQLTSHLLERIGAQHGLVPPTFTHDALAALCDLAWPGNVRQLANCLERAVLHDDSGVVTADTILACCDGARRQSPARVVVPTGPQLAHEPARWVQQLRDLNLEVLNHEVMLEALRRTAGNRRRAAAMLGVHVRTVRRYLAERAGPPSASADS